MYEDHSGEFVCGYCGLNDLCFYFLDEIKCSFSKANENPDDIYFVFIDWQLSTGEVWIQYNDGSQMVVQSSVTSIKYTDSGGTVTR